MCIHGDSRSITVVVPADLSCTGEPRWKIAKIDRCISGIVGALQEFNINMRGSCCGHGNCEGAISLQDGRVLLILDPEDGKRYNAWVTKGRDVRTLLRKEKP